MPRSLLSRKAAAIGGAALLATVLLTACSNDEPSNNLTSDPAKSLSNPTSVTAKGLEQKECITSTPSDLKATGKIKNTQEKELDLVVTAVWLDKEGTKQAIASQTFTKVPAGESRDYSLSTSVANPPSGLRLSCVVSATAGSMP